MRSVITRASKSKTVAARHGQRHGGRLFHVASTSPGIHDHANAREDLNEHCARRKLSSITPASPPRDPKSSLQPSKTSPRTGSSGSNSIRNVNNPAGTSTRTNTVKRGGSKYINHVYDIHTRGNDASVLLRLGAARAKSTAAAPASTQMDEADSAVNDRYDDLAASPSPGVSGSVSMRNDKNNTTSNSLPGRGLVKSFRLTDIGEGIMEVEVLQWFVAPGDRVRQFDKLCEVQSDKANVEITSRYDGVVRTLHGNVGDMVQTGAVLVDIEESAGAVVGGSSSSSPDAVLSSSDKVELSEVLETNLPASVSAPSPPEEKPAEEPNTASRKKVLATPAVRRLCRELSIDLSSARVAGTGAGQRVLKGDVLAYATANGIALPTARSTPVATSPAEGLDRQGDDERSEDEIGSSPSLWPSPSYEDPRNEARSAAPSDAGGEMTQEQKDARGEVDGAMSDPRDRRKSPVSVPIKGVQRAMMEAMRKALEVPHMTFSDEINADRLSLLRSDLKEAAERRSVRLSYMPFIVKATSMALAAFPSLNASLSEDKSCLLHYQDHNIGVAMDTERGLVVPCISSVQERSILDIAEELNRLQRLGATGKLGESDLTGTTFTLSNIGSIGGTYTSPVIMHPQVCIGAFGRMQRLPRFDTLDPEKVIAARVFPVSWSADHRVVDGGTLARFSNMWKEYLENPARMLADTR